MVIALPSFTVRKLLPFSLELQAQNVTPPGTHPVVFLFHSFLHCQFSFPTGLPPMNFLEQTFGIPFVSVSGGRGFATGQSQCYFMPKLYLNDLWVLMVGRNIWGFDKELAAVILTENSYAVTSRAGRRLVSIEWTGDETPQPALGGYPEFEVVRQMLNQPLLSFSPMGIGPFVTMTDFERSWNLGTVRKLQSVLTVDSCYVRGFDGGRFETDSEPGALRTVLGSYEISAQWWLSYPYLPPSSPIEYPMAAPMDRY